MTNETLTQLNASISRLFGIIFHDNRLNELHKAIQSVCKYLKIKDEKELISRIISENLSDKERNTLIKHLTIGETYFFRDDKIFRHLKDTILPDIVKRKGNANIKILSIGCSTGEEPYSIAITINKELPHLNAKIIAIDINEESIQQAKTGIYKKWSFRKAPKWLVSSYFHKTQDNLYEINSQIKNMVEFHTFNVADINKPLNKVFTSMDIVFCRNLIIYFPDSIRRFLAETIYSTLTDNGWLIVSPTEASQDLFSRFQTINTGDAILYKKISPQSHAKIYQEHKPQTFNRFNRDTTHTITTKEFSSPEIKPAQKPTPSKDTADTANLNINDILDSAIKMANMGDFEKAENLLLRISTVDNLNAETYFLLSSIAEERGDYQRAEEIIRKILYINPNEPIAYFRLGNMLMRSGKSQDAKKSFNSALSILKSIDKNTFLQRADGLNLERLIDICQSMIAEIECK